MINVVWFSLWLGCSDTEELQSTNEAIIESIEEHSEVGPVKATVRVSPKESKLGDPLTLHLEVTALQNVEVELPPFGEALGRFQISNFQPREKDNDDGSHVWCIGSSPTCSEKVFELDHYSEAEHQN